ncbi:hypothetical protein FLK61_39185 [Paenalkalicoccus suaedae]|uniref:Uncharacterized protein n=1 Tax=Paenalkalicoccus suaedae TaxID=2592382 RepID=A0A859FHT7_9BACI|nr:hypothetical protein [Paenalkalicoccus suaedae]QKS72641.1 hypothetical protein FLK61_39185 [Paenalkalicoccus suaedae]
MNPIILNTEQESAFSLMGARAIEAYVRNETVMIMFWENRSFSQAIGMIESINLQAQQILIDNMWISMELLLRVEKVR